jgi:hypothetical protein
MNQVSLSVPSLHMLAAAKITAENLHKVHPDCLRSVMFNGSGPCAIKALHMIGFKPDNSNSDDLITVATSITDRIIEQVLDRTNETGDFDQGYDAIFPPGSLTQDDENLLQMIYGNRMSGLGLMPFKDDNQLTDNNNVIDCLSCPLAWESPENKKIIVTHQDKQITITLPWFVGWHDKNKIKKLSDEVLESIHIFVAPDNRTIVFTIGHPYDFNMYIFDKDYPERKLRMYSDSIIDIDVCQFANRICRFGVDRCFKLPLSYLQGTLPLKQIAYFYAINHGIQYCGDRDGLEKYYLECLRKLVYKPAITVLKKYKEKIDQSLQKYHPWRLGHFKYSQDQDLLFCLKGIVKETYSEQIVSINDVVSRVTPYLNRLSKEARQEKSVDEIIEAMIIDIK